MAQPEEPQRASREAEEEKHRQQVRQLFANMPHEVPFFLFTEKGKNEPFNRAAKQVIQSLQKISPRVTLKEFDLGHKMAKEYKVSVPPTILFDPAHYQIRWLGAPVGEEAKTLLVATQMMGYKETNLSPDSKKILERMKEGRQIKLFVSPTCPYCPQQAVNALKAALTKPETVSLEIIDIQANPDIARRYSAESVPQTFGNEKLVALGAQPEELFLLSIEKLEEQRIFIPESDAPEIETDLLIVGGGPAGLTAGIYAARSGLRTVIVEKGLLGGQIATTPVVENYPGITQVGGKGLVEIMVTHALEYCNLFPGEEVMEIRPGDPIWVVTSRRRFKTKAVLLATGATYRRLDVPGETLFAGRGVSYCSTCDGPLFKGKKVLIVGGGNSAVTEALNLKNIGVDVTLVHRRDSFRAQDHLVKSLTASQIPVLFNTVVQEIQGDRKVTGAELANTRTKEKTLFPADGVFVAVGYDPEVRLANKLGVTLTPEGYIQHDSHHRTNIPGVYAAGDVEGGYKQIVIAAGKGSEAALTIFEDLLNPYWKKQA
jgi:thioredoxin reductase (NADPH)